MDYNGIAIDIAARLGLHDVTDSDLAGLSAAIGRTLEVRVGSRLSQGLTELQLREFESLQSEGSSAAVDWLLDKIPFYRSIVQDETQRLVQDVVDHFQNREAR